MFCGRKHSKAAKLLQRSLPEGCRAKLPCAKATATKQSSDSKLTPRKDNSSFMDNWHRDSNTAVSPGLELPVVLGDYSLCLLCSQPTADTRWKTKTQARQKESHLQVCAHALNMDSNHTLPFAFCSSHSSPNFVLRISDFVSCGQYNLCLLSVVGMKECAEE